jgi:hypothetical protein
MVDGDTHAGVRCLIHASNLGLGQGQDAWVAPTSTTPYTITAGSSNPLVQGGSKIKSGDNISTSNSVVTVPIFNGAVVGGQVNVVGFLQVFIDEVQSSPNCAPGVNSCVKGHILNVLGCGATLGSPAITQGSSVAIPVRLIHQ